MRVSTPGDLKELLDQVIGWFRRHAGCERLQRVFVELIREVFADRGLRLSGARNSLELKSMLATQLEAWKAQWFAEGNAKSKAEGKAEALIALLAGRFGAVTLLQQKRSRAARLATLERWFKRAIVAPDLRSVFKSPR